MMSSPQLPWKKLEIAILIVRAICILASLAAVGFGIAMGLLPSYYGDAEFIPSEYGGMTTPTVSLVLVGRLFLILFLIRL
jgi:hypothetical protein